MKFKSIPKSDDDHYLKDELSKLIQSDSKIFDFIQVGVLDGLWYWDLTDPEKEWMDENFWKTLGQDHTKRKHLASEWQDLIHPDDLIVATKNFKKHCENPEYPYDQIVRYKHSDNSTVWVRCRGIVIRDENGTPIRMLGTHNNVTELKLAEEKLKKTAQEKLIHMNDQLKLFAHSVSHDLISPLRHIAQVNKKIKEDMGEFITGETNKYFEIVEQAGEKMQTLIFDVHQLTTLSTQARNLQTINVLDILKSIKREFYLEIENSSVLFGFENIPGEVKGFPTLLRLVFQNLIRNAIKYKSNERNLEIKVSCEELDEFWQFTIKDNGIGIDQEYSELIFNVFTRLNKKEGIEGSGLGLNICKTSIEYHKGVIWLENNDVQGAEFVFKIHKNPLTWDVVDIEHLF